MTSQIDPTVPIVGTPTTASVRANFQIAHDEITALQNAANAVQASQVAISPAIGSLGPNVQSGLQWLNTNMTPMTVTANYLPLVGGTLTGTLNGTNVQLSGGVFAKAESRTTANAGSDSISTFYNSTPTRVGYVGWEHVSNTIRMNNDITGASLSLNAAGASVFTGGNVQATGGSFLAVVGGGIFNGTNPLVVGAATGSGYTNVYDATASASLVLGNAGDTVNYYRQTGHSFQNKAASLTYTYIDANGLKLANAYPLLMGAANTTQVADVGGTLWIANDTSVHVGTVNRAANFAIFQPNGTYNQTGAWLALSDPALKQDVTPYTRGLDAIRGLNPVTFRYRAGTTFGNVDGPSDPLIGLMADEVEPHVPEIVGETTAKVGGKDQTVSTLASGNLIYALINSIKELSARLEALESASAA